MRPLLTLALLTACAPEASPEAAAEGTAVEGAHQVLDAQPDPCAGPELPYNGLDDDCDPATPDDDLDGDGFSAMSENGAKGIDCDDSDPESYPQAPEIYGDGIDQDCDGSIDEGCGGQQADLEVRGLGVDQLELGEVAAVLRFDGDGGVCEAGVDGIASGVALWFSWAPHCDGEMLWPGGSAFDGLPLYLCAEMGNGPAHVGKSFTVWALTEDGQEVDASIDVVEG